jgi:hypothetical protein
MTGLSLGHSIGFSRTSSNLDGTVTIRLWGFNLRYPIWLNLHYRNRNRIAFFSEDTGHAALSTD